MIGVFVHMGASRFTEPTPGTKFMRIMTYWLFLALGLIFPNINISGQQLTGQQEVKAAIISIQKEIVDLTNPRDAFNCKQFVSLRQSISAETGKQIVLLIKDNQLTDNQSQIGICLLAGLPETNYWEATAVLLSTNTPEDILYNVLGMPLICGSGFANAYTNETYKVTLLRLKMDFASKTDSVSKGIESILNSILSGEAAKIYRDYLKHPERYGYSPIQVHSIDKP
jgi:hypothetical protein